jgi:hypothetical protein
MLGHTESKAERVSRMKKDIRELDETMERNGR